MREGAHPDVFGHFPVSDRNLLEEFLFGTGLEGVLAKEDCVKDDADGPDIGGGGEMGDLKDRMGDVIPWKPSQGTCSWEYRRRC